MQAGNDLLRGIPCATDVKIGRNWAFDDPIKASKVSNVQTSDKRFIQGKAAAPAPEAPPKETDSESERYNCINNPSQTVNFAKKSLNILRE
ncbi:MAG: hypothetical protein LUQ38_11650 [Methanotrichaceae archaeon]|nr:hypothetical protein [Methanotrichaceae archaeon]